MFRHHVAKGTNEVNLVVYGVRRTKKPREVTSKLARRKLSQWWGAVERRLSLWAEELYHLA